MYRAPADFELNIHIKTICNPRCVADITNPHFVFYKDTLNSVWKTISENGSFILGPYFCDSICSKLRINHYFCKSEEEYLKKLKRGWPDQEHVELPRERVENDLKKACQVCNEVYDPIMNRFIEKLKQANTSQEENENG